jgi:hypothetical protein
MREHHRFSWLLLGLIVTFALAAAGQAPSRLPGQTAPATPGQTPEPAAQQPATPLDKKEEPKQPSAPSTPAVTGENQQFIEIKVGADYTKIDPDVRDEQGRPARSFLTPGKNVTADVSYFQDHAFGSKRIQALAIYRNNNDPRVDPESNSLQRGYVRVSSPNWEWNVGDALIGYSRLTYNQNIKGLSVNRKFAGGFRLMANAGVFTDRWGSVWKDGLQGKPFTRAVAGLRAEQRIGQDKTIGFNISHGRDMQSSIRPDLQQFGLIPLNNQIASIDARLTFHRVFTVEGEWAYSQTNFDTRIYADKRKDYGGRLDTNLRVGRFFLRTNYVRLMPSFLSLNARQLADLQDETLRAGVDLSDSVTLEGSYRRTNNNLREQRPEGATVFRMPEVRMTFRNLAGLGKAIFEVGYRERQQDGPFRAADPLKGRKEDRRTPIPFAEVAIPLGNSLISVGFEHRMNQNNLVPSENTTANRWSGSLRSNFGLGRWTFAPMFRYEMEREEFFRVFGFNSNRSVLAAGYIDAPKYLAFEATYRALGASLFAECVEASGTPCNPMMPVVPGTTILLPSGFRRPAFHGAITFKLFNNEDRFIVVAIDRNTNFFALPGRDFNERVISLTFVYRVRR